MRTIGVDVGKSGAVACIDGDEFYTAFDMPVYTVQKKGGGEERIVDRQRLMNLFKMIKEQTGQEVMCFIEKQYVFGREGTKSAFSLGEQFGFLVGLLTALGIPYEEVYPQNWMKSFSLKKEAGTKNASYQKASSMFPKAILRTERGRILDGRCDALLIAEYGRRKRGKGNDESRSSGQGN